MTLGELLEKNGAYGMTVINEKADLGRQVATVESTETPDIAGYVPQHTLLLTTAMSYKNNQEELCGLIRALDRLPSAGIAIKLGRFINELDEQVIKTADELGFPLLRIPMDRTLGDIYHKSLACLWDNENDDLLYALNLQKKFYNLILHGASLKKLLSNLNLALKKPVLILDIFGEICSSSHTGKREEQMAANALRKLNLTEKEFWQYRRISDTPGGEEFLIYPIRAESANTHYLVIFDHGEEKLDVPGYAIEQILLIFGMHFYKNLYLCYNEMQLRESFLKILIDKNKNDCLTARHILASGQAFGFRSCTYYKVIVAQLKNLEDKKFQPAQFMRKEERYILIYGWLRKRLEAHYSGDILILPDTGEWRYVLLMQESARTIDKKLKEIHERIKTVFGEELVFAWGNNVFEVKTIEHSYWRAIDGLREMEPGSYLHQYHAKNIMELIRSISSSQIDEVCLNVLKSLAHPEDEMTMELKKTLKVYLDCRCSIMETANRLFLHRNTVRYRIKKCEEILDNDLSDPEYCFQLQFSLMLSDL